MSIPRKSVPAAPHQAGRPVLPGVPAHRAQPAAPAAPAPRQAPAPTPAGLLEKIFQEAFRDEVPQATQLSFENLVTSMERSKLPEPIFRENFLPFFTGQQRPDPQNGLYAQWIGIAGAPTAEVDVIDEEGKTVFVVPALLNTSGLQVLRSRHQGPSIMEMVSDFNDEAVGLPTVARNKFYKSLAEKGAEIITNDPATQRDQDNWRKIAEHYRIETPDQKAKAAPKNSSDDEPIGYD